MQAITVTKLCHMKIWNMSFIYSNASYMKKYFSVASNLNDTELEPQIEKLEQLQKYAQSMVLEGHQIPNVITNSQLDTLLKLDKKKLVRKLGSLAEKEEKKHVKQKDNIDRDATRAIVHTNLNYTLWRNSLFCKYTSNYSSHLKSFSTANKHQLLSPLVIDCGFQHTERELQSLISQVRMLYLYNRVFNNPFDIHLCNVYPQFQEVLNKAMDRFSKYLHVTEDSYLDIFSPQRLVYLSPDARESLHSLDDNAVYILGALKDTGRELPYTMAKSKTEKIKCYKLPIDSMLKRQYRSLSLSHCVQVLLHYNDSPKMCWRTACKCLPRMVTSDPFHTQELKKYPTRQ